MGSSPRLRGDVRIPRRSARACKDRVASRGGVGGASPYEGREFPVCFRVSGRVVQGGQFLRRAAPPSRYGRRFEESERLLAAVGGETGVYAEFGRSGRILILVAGVHYLSDPRGHRLPAPRYTRALAGPTTPGRWIRIHGAPTFPRVSRAFSSGTRPSGRPSRRSWMRSAANRDSSTTSR